MGGTNGNGGGRGEPPPLPGASADGDQLTANLSSLIASELLTAPPTRLVA
jgi:hypothetical protein